MIKRPLLALRALLSGRLGKPRQTPATVARVDLDRLLGTWFEVARLPSLEADGPGQHSVNVTATYAKRPDWGGRRYGFGRVERWRERQRPGRPRDFEPAAL